MALTKIQGGVVKDTSQLSITSVNATGVITAASFVGSGAGLTGITGGASQVYDSTVFAYQNVIDSNITVSQPYKVAAIYTDSDVTVDIESGIQLSVDDGCILNIIDL